MNITRPAPKLQINLDLKHDAHIGDQVWVDQLPPLEEQTPDLLYIVYVSPEMRDRIMGSSSSSGMRSKVACTTYFTHSPKRRTKSRIP